MFYRGAGLRHKIKRQKEWSFILLHDDTPLRTIMEEVLIQPLYWLVRRRTDGWRFKWPGCFYVTVAYFFCFVLFYSTAECSQFV